VERERDQTIEQPVRIPAGDVLLEGDLALPPGARGVVLFAHGSGSSRRSPRNRFVASALRGAVGTLLFDLLSESEETIDRLTGELRFDIALLARRLLAATDWLATEQATRDKTIGYFGSSTGAAAALVAAAARPEVVGGVVSRGGRPDLAGHELRRVFAPTLLIVGGEDGPVIPLNESALEEIPAPKEMAIVPGATHLFEEPGALEQVAQLARRWFERYLVGARAPAAHP
jgi:pimeloyl-ACP methyl ester carboxylesterase